MPSQVEEECLDQLARIHAVVLSEVMRGHRGLVNVDDHFAVVWAGKEDLLSVAHKVVEGWKHLCDRIRVYPVRVRNEWTFKEVYDIVLEKLVDLLEYGPHFGRNDLGVERKTVHQIQRVV